MSLTEIAANYIRAVQTGDQAALASLIAPDIVWHQPGRNKFSGTHHGISAVANMLGGMMETAGGTFAITGVSRYMENGNWVAIELEFAAQREGYLLSQQGLDLLRIENGQIVEARLFSSDQDQEDAFWGH